MFRFRIVPQAVTCLLALWLYTSAMSGAAIGAEPPAPPLLVHYMPWFEAKPPAAAWGWHWTMNKVDPDKQIDGVRPVAAHYAPLIGPYDSGDPHVLEYHLLLMRLAGIDGVIVDWYGLSDFRDYALLHRNTLRLFDVAERLGMKYAVCYEDQSIPALVEAGKLAKEERVSHAVGEIAWMAKHWFPRQGYVRLAGKPVLLSFGQTGLTDDEWTACLARSPATAYFSLHHRRPAAVGAFDWPLPKEGAAAQRRFLAEARNWRAAIPVAYPRFVDFYKEAGLHESYGRIEDADGETWRESLDAALKARAPLVQIATWNDWGEGPPSSHPANSSIGTWRSCARGESRSPKERRRIYAGRESYSRHAANRQDRTRPNAWTARRS